MSEHQYRICVVGPGSVGKSAITIQYLSQQFVSDYDPTIEEYYKNTIYVDNKVAYLEIFDTAGQDEYKSLRSYNFQSGDGFLLIYSVANRKSFEEVLDFQQEILNSKDLNNVPIVLLANKIDLDEKFHVVTKREGVDCASNLGCSFLQTSAKKVINISEAFQECVRLIRKQRQSKQPKKKKQRKRFSCSIM
ncbi:ras-like protein [Anaeramoeba flamelloides]|uniref:Ras-like protein n=1 Tax=Anaeramoeba flamelloides TaxID=1746091 RepID=A0ABQ8YDR8_9EUKA|nr:ras-like protein [Anaeramoeba flamelloides]